MNIYAVLYLYCFLRKTSDASQIEENRSGRIAYSKHDVLDFHPKIDRSSASPGLAKEWHATPANDIYGLFDEAETWRSKTPPNFEFNPFPATTTVQYENPGFYSDSFQVEEGRSSSARSLIPPPHPFLSYEDNSVWKDINPNKYDSAGKGKTWEEILEEVTRARPAFLHQPTMNANTTQASYPVKDFLNFNVKDEVSRSFNRKSDINNFDAEKRRPNRQNAPTMPNGSSNSWKSLPHHSNLDIREHGSSKATLLSASQKQYRKLQGIPRHAMETTSDELLEFFKSHPLITTWSSGDKNPSDEKGLPSGAVRESEGRTFYNYPSFYTRQVDERENQKNSKENTRRMEPGNIWEKYIKPHIYTHTIESSFYPESMKTSQEVGRRVPVMNNVMSPIKKKIPSVEELDGEAAKILSEIDKNKYEYLKMIESHFQTSNIFPQLKLLMENKWHPYQQQKATTRSLLQQHMKPILGTLSDKLPSHEFPILPNYKNLKSKLISGDNSASVSVVPPDKYTDEDHFTGPTTTGTLNYLDLRKFWPDFVKSKLKSASKSSKNLAEYLNHLSILPEKFPIAYQNLIPVTSRDVDMTISPDFSNLPPGLKETIEAGAASTPGKHEGGGFKIRIYKS